MMETPNDAWDHIGGAHPIRFEAPDIVICRPTGVITADDMTAGLAYLDKASKQIGRGVFYLSDLSRVTRYAPSLAVHGFKAYPKGILRATATFGANVYQRAVIDMIQRAARLLGQEVSRVPMASFADEAAARAWIEELRREG